MLTKEEGRPGALFSVKWVLIAHHRLDVCCGADLGLCAPVCVLYSRPQSRPSRMRFICDMKSTKRNKVE